MPKFDSKRIDESLNNLKDDLSNFDFEGKVELNKKKTWIDNNEYEIPIIIEINGDEIFYSLTNPLTRNELFDKGLQEGKDIYALPIESMNELEVKRAIHNVTSQILKKENV